MPPLTTDSLSKEQSNALWLSLVAFILILGFSFGVPTLRFAWPVSLGLGHAEALLEVQMYQISEPGVYRLQTTHSNHKNLKLYATSQGLIDGYSLEEDIFIPSSGDALSLVARGSNLLEDGLLIKLKPGSRLLLSASSPLHTSDLRIQRITRS